MARDIPFTPGVGGRAGADEVTISGQSVKVQEVKLAAGKVGEYIGDVGGALVDGDSNRSALYTRERADVREFTPAVTVSTSAYTANMVLGGLITIPNVVAVAGNMLRLLSIRTYCPVSHGGISFWIFDDTPAATFTDHAAFPSFGAGDIGKLRAAAGGSDYSLPPVALHWTENYAPYLPDIKPVGTSLYVVMQVQGTPTFAATTDFHLVITAERL